MQVKNLKYMTSEREVDEFDASERPVGEMCTYFFEALDNHPKVNYINDSRSVFSIFFC